MNGGLTDVAKKEMDDRLREIISALPIQAKESSPETTIRAGYVFEHNRRTAENDSLIHARIIGRSLKTLVLDLGNYNGYNLCARLPIKMFGDLKESLIIHEKTRPLIKSCLPPLREILKDFNIVIPYMEDRTLYNPHPDYNEETVWQYITDKGNELLRIAQEKKSHLPMISVPPSNTWLDYTLSEDLTEGGKFTLYDASHLYTLDSSEEELCTHHKEGGWVQDSDSTIKFAGKLDTIANNALGGKKRLRELLSLQHDAASAIISRLIAGDYRVIGVSFNSSHDQTLYAAKAMFSLRISNEDGTSDLVLQDPKNICLWNAN